MFEVNPNWQEELSGQILLFGLVGKLLYSAPTGADLEPLAADDVFAEAPFATDQPDVISGLGLLQDWGQTVRTDPDEEIGNVQGDYTRLFMGTAGVPISPWESVYYTEERRVFAESTLSVRNIYRRFGLEVDGLYHEPDDHIGLELLFISHLASRAYQAVKAGDGAEVRRLFEGQRSFLRRHVLRWAPLWCSLMLEHARTDYYRGLALLVRGALAELATLLDLEIPETVRA